MMGKKVDLPRVESYSLALTEKLANQFFASKLAISGPEILKFTAIDQVNFFIIKNLLDKWKEETSKLRSPYFDYEAGEVKTALEKLNNTLSNNISIRKEFFKPLLQKAISDTLLYILSPADYLIAEYVSGKAAVSVKEFSEKVKYFRINKRLIESIKGKLCSISLEAVPVTNAEAIIVDAFAELKSELERPEPYVDSFSGLLGVKISEFLEEAVEIIPKIESFVSEPQPETIAVKSEDTVKEPVQSIKNTNNAPAVGINQKYSKDQLTINDMLMQDKKVSTLADRLTKTKIDDLKAAIPLNQKFLFINELFKGGNADFNTALAELQQCQSLTEAMDLLNTNYAAKFQWNPENPEVKNFYDLVERKFL
ncbi:MAG TPA: hypothetical protein VIK89_11885 [Cytophagaceae bacterium]